MIQTLGNLQAGQTYHLTGQDQESRVIDVPVTVTMRSTQPTVEILGMTARLVVTPDDHISLNYLDADGSYAGVLALIYKASFQPY